MHSSEKIGLLSVVCFGAEETTIAEETAIAGFGVVAGGKVAGDVEGLIIGDKDAAGEARTLVNAVQSTRVTMDGFITLAMEVATC